MSAIQDLRILLTRAAADNVAWAGALSELGAVPLEHPCLAQQVLPEAASPLRSALERAAWLALCSRHAVRAVAELVPGSDSEDNPGSDSEGNPGSDSEDHPGRRPEGARLACVGPVTAAETERLLGSVALIAPGGTALSLAHALLERLAADEIVLLPGAERGRDELADEFQAAGRELERLAVYRTRAVDPGERGQLPAADAIFFASPSAVEAFAQGPPPPAGALLVRLGPSTSTAVRAAGWTVAAESHTRDLEGMIEALTRARSSGSLPH